jgi:hypothetical protein
VQARIALASLAVSRVNSMTVAKYSQLARGGAAIMAADEIP